MGMTIEREMVVQIAVSTTIVVLFSLAIVAVGVLYYSDGFTSQGAIALVGTIAGFIVIMSLASYFLIGR